MFKNKPSQLGDKDGGCVFLPYHRGQNRVAIAFLESPESDLLKVFVSEFPLVGEKDTQAICWPVE